MRRSALTSWDRQLPTDADVIAKRAIYAREEPRDLAYKVARHVVELAWIGDAEFSPGDGAAILLMSWNVGFYRFRPDLGRRLALDLDQLIRRHFDFLMGCRAREPGSYAAARDAGAVERAYRDFVAVLWPVGTAKSLHVLAPSFFPIWDASIARAFGLRLSPPSASVSSYLSLMEGATRFARESRISDPLKALDEWAYVTYTLRR